MEVVSDGVGESGGGSQDQQKNKKTKKQL